MQIRHIEEAAQAELVVVRTAGFVGLVEGLKNLVLLQAVDELLAAPAPSKEVREGAHAWGHGLIGSGARIIGARIFRLSVRRYLQRDPRVAHLDVVARDSRPARLELSELLRVGTQPREAPPVECTHLYRLEAIGAALIPATTR